MPSRFNTRASQYFPTTHSMLKTQLLITPILIQRKKLLFILKTLINNPMLQRWRNCHEHDPHVCNSFNGAILCYELPYKTICPLLVGGALFFVGRKFTIGLPKSASNRVMKSMTNQKMQTNNLNPFKRQERKH